MLMLTHLQIRELRLGMGLSPEKFAELLGVTWSTVYMWERNETHPRYKKMLMLNEFKEKLEASAVKAG